MPRVRKRAITDWKSLICNWTYRDRSRFVPLSGPPHAWGAWSGSSTPSTVPVTVTASRGRQETVDESHPAWRSSRKPTAQDGDYGGAFDSTSSGVTISDGIPRLCKGSYIDQSQYEREVVYSGSFLACNPNITPPTVVHSNLNALGSEAVARCKPTNNIANVATSLGELFREGLPKLAGLASWESKTLAAKSGQEYLNSEFGWKPLVGDIRSVAYATANAHRILSQYEKNAGKVVRRRYEFPEVVNVETGNLGPYNGWVYSNGWNEAALRDYNRPMPNLRYITTTTRKSWFSGAFTYHLPTGYKSRNKLVSMAAKAGPLLGLELTPDVVWSLTPWSWALDWFSNSGDIVSNLSDWASDGLVMKYGYVMETVRSETTYYLDGGSQYNFTGNRFPSTVTVWSESKRRRAASPFGFGVSWEGMTPRQLAISAALGLTRAFH